MRFAGCDLIEIDVFLNMHLKAFSLEGDAMEELKEFLSSLDPCVPGSEVEDVTMKELKDYLSILEIPSAINPDFISPFSRSGSPQRDKSENPETELLDILHVSRVKDGTFSFISTRFPISMRWLLKTMLTVISAETSNTVQTSWRQWNYH